MNINVALMNLGIILILTGIAFLIIKSIIKAISIAIVLGIIFNVFFIGNFQGVKDFSNKYLKSESAAIITDGYSDFIDKSHENAIIDTSKVLHGVTNTIENNDNIKELESGISDVEKQVNELQDVKKQLIDLKSSNEKNNIK